MGMFSELKKIEEKKTEVKKKPVADVPPEKSPPPPVQNKTRKITAKKENNEEENITSNITSNIALVYFLHLSEKQIDELRDPSNDVQTFRLTEKDKEWVKDTAYMLSKEIRRGSVSQTDILRLSFLLFEKLLKTNKPEIIRIFEKIK
jgi:hypothetical protein